MRQDMMLGWAAMGGHAALRARLGVRGFVLRLLGK